MLLQSNIVPEKSCLKYRAVLDCGGGIIMVANNLIRTLPVNSSIP